VSIMCQKEDESMKLTNKSWLLYTSGIELKKGKCRVSIAQ